MWIASDWRDFEVLDCSGGEKLERWGDYFLVRPDPQVIWNTPRNHPKWKTRDASYSRSTSGGGAWNKNRLPERWTVGYKDLTFNIKPMNFKHTGLFPEQAANWDWAMEKIRAAGRPVSVLNLFAYTGGATVACLKAGASVCHVDAAKGMVAWAKEMPSLPACWTSLCAGSWTTAGSSWPGRSGGGTSTTPLLWTRPAMGAGRGARSGSWRKTSGASWSFAARF